MSTTQIKAEMIDGTLIVSVTGNDNPVLWRMELPKSKAVFFELDQNGKTHSLVMRSGKTKKDCIAKFSQKETAQNALSIVIDTMMNGDGTPKQAKVPKASKKEKKKKPENKEQKKGSKPVFMALILFTLFLFISFEYLQYNWENIQEKNANQQLSSIPSSTNKNTASIARKEVRKGVPISADDLFQ